MLNYAICEIGGSQYKIVPGKPLDVVLKAEPNQKLEFQVLALSEDGKIKIGKPYLKEKISLKCIEILKGEKVRVAKYSAKANYRRVTGSRANLAKLIWDLPAGRQGVKK